jgi:hypothetical protein
MRSQPLPQTESSRCPFLHVPSGGTARRPTVSLALCAASMLISGALVAAQSGPAQTNRPPAPASTSTHKSAHPHKKSAAVIAPAPPPAPPAPVLPPPPDWPANDQPVAASVVYDSRGLMVVASNSSLAQILKEVSIDTGAKLEGMSADPHTMDQRIYGTYGPGPARDVLKQLLDGSGFNVLLIGDRGQGTPRRIVLSPQSGGGMPNTAHNTAPQPSTDDNDSDQSPPEAEQEQPPPQPGQNGAPVPVRTPQQMIQERDRQMQQMQNGQQNPQN